MKLPHTCLTLCALPVIRAVISSPSKYLSVGRLDPASSVKVGSISRLDVRALDTVPAWKKKQASQRNSFQLFQQDTIFLPENIIIYYLQELTSCWSTYLFTKLFGIRHRAKNQY